MNKREKILALLIGVCVLLFVVIFGLKAFFLKPQMTTNRSTATPSRRARIISRLFRARLPRSRPSAQV